MIVNYLNYMIMADIDKINDFIQSYLKKNKLSSITVVEIASHLDKQGLLKDREDRRGAPLRSLCRKGKIHCSSQPNCRNWIIKYDPNYELRSNSNDLESIIHGQQCATLQQDETTIGQTLEKLNVPDDYSEESLIKCGFVGFRPIKKCRMDYAVFPKVPGVYIVLRRSKKRPEYLTIGSGGHFKDEDPNVSDTELSDNWVEGASVVYIGMTTTTLHKRLSAYMKFGEGRKIGHKGGRYIWQLADHEDLIVCWKEMPNGSPKEYETELILDFKNKHGNRRPFANLQD